MPFWDSAESTQVLSFIRAILSKGRDLGITDIGPTKMCGLLFLLDVEHVRRYREPITSIDWIWHERGPFSAEAAYGARRDETIEEVGGMLGGSRYRLLADQTFALEQSVDNVLEDVMVSYGRMTAAAIKSHCYRNTESMKRVQEVGRRGDRLNLGLERQDLPPDPETVDRLATIVEGIGFSRPQKSDHTTEFVDLIKEGSTLRRRATSRIIKDA